MLEQDITIYSDEIDLLPRLHRSSGTEFTACLEQYTNRYYNGHIPQKPWSHLSPEESEKLVAQSPPENYQNSIGIGRIPHEIFHLAGKLNIDANNPQNYLKKNRNNSHYQRFEEVLLAYFEPLLVKREGLELLTIYCGKTGLPTCTFNYDTKEFIGLHYDSWDKRDWNDRLTVRNRICINLGIEERYFLFVNLELQTILKKLKIQGVHEYDADKGPYRPFFENYPDYPVIKVRLEPGEYYIAPTEVMIHDGCTEGKTYNDVTFTILGYFKTSGMSQLK